jgi:hypothetical protein
MFEPKATASHLDSTPLRRADGFRECLFIGLDRKWPADSQNGANDPELTSARRFLPLTPWLLSVMLLTQSLS